MTIRFTTPGVQTADDGFSQITTTEVVDDDLLGQHIREWITKDRGSTYAPRAKVILLTVEDCWSGYSEWTITNTWQEVWVTVPEWNYERKFDDLPAFFAALGTVGERSQY